MSKHRIVVVGCGNISKAWIAYTLKRDDSSIVALVDMHLNHAEAAKAKYKLECPVYTDVREAIRKNEANLVFDLTIPEAHCAITTAAFEEGCHVFGEKPMASSMEEAAIMVKAAADSGRTYAIMQNRRYLKEMMAFRDLVQSGTVGPIGFVTSDFFLGLHNGGYRETMDNPLLLDMAIHTFDQSRFITGQDPVAVHCTTFNPAGSWFAGAAAAICTFEYEDGSCYSYRGCYSAEGAPTSWQSSWRVVGSKGTVIWDGRTAPYAEIVIPTEEIVHENKHKRITPELTWTGQEQQAGCLDEMFDALNKGHIPSTVCTDNIKSLAMLHGVIRSLKEGCKVRI
ncbi:Gfo/Idh/MocA family protein [Paenibacillus periandrae]|uniref:Gfo/Idh/MocA family protein n=1 Tax=Paenibacillus periandrae TaxID=1761741 RepID=UPI001F09723A|nr:Gfo/Idh/MocA family oxidoreductase [Paenibacillus periandrae]